MSANKILPSSRSANLGAAPPLRQPTVSFDMLKQNIAVDKEKRLDKQAICL